MPTSIHTSGLNPRAFRGASGLAGLTVAALLVTTLPSVWAKPGMRESVVVEIRVVGGQVASRIVREHARSTLNSDAAFLRALEQVAVEHRLPEVASLAAIRADLVVEAADGSHPACVARLAYLGSEPIGQAILLQMADDYSATGCRRLAERFRAEEIELRDRFNATRIWLSHLSRDVDQSGRYIAVLHRSLRDARTTNASTFQIGGKRSAPLAAPAGCDAEQLVRLLGQRGGQLRELKSTQRSVETQARELDVLRLRLREVTAMRLEVISLRPRSFAPNMLSLASLATLSVTVTGVGLVRFLRHASPARFNRLSQARRDLGVPVVAFTAPQRAVVA